MNEHASVFSTGGLLYDDENEILSLLLKDRTTDQNIIWATDTYLEYGDEYAKCLHMFPDFKLDLIFEGNMMPRVLKTKEQQQLRTKSRAEVFTPSWICNRMNNFCDEQWFNRKEVFNVEVNYDDYHTWAIVRDKIIFESDTDWQRYVDSTRIEITCGEAPYLVSRYDTTTGEKIPVNERIGILDRKLRVVNENTHDLRDWFKWVQRAYKATYGFEYQGDNLFFARTNLILTFIEYYEDRFDKKPAIAKIKKIADIISWNIWQMDGLKDIVPFSDNNIPVYSKIKDWQSDKIIEYRSMKGDV